MEHCRSSKSTSSVVIRPESPLLTSAINSGKDQVSISKQSNFIVVWYDDRVQAMNDNTEKAIRELEHIVGTLTIFDNGNKCVEYINNIKDRQILLIVDESNGAQVVRRVLGVSQLKSIYILCFNQSLHPPWAAAYKSVRCIFVDSTTICERIEMDTGDNSITWDVIGTSSIESATPNNINKQEVQFMYSQLLKYTLTEMSYSNDHMDNLIEFFRKDRPRDTEKIKEFRDHAIKRPVWCYTNYVFLYETLNAALRTCNVDVLYTMGVFIKALHQQIAES